MLPRLNRTTSSQAAGLPRFGYLEQYRGYDRTLIISDR
jgi:hypothetical protein